MRLLSNKPILNDKSMSLCLLQKAQKPRQHTFAPDQGRWANQPQASSQNGLHGIRELGNRNMPKEMPEELGKYLISEDELGLVIRAHLYIESALDELLNALIPATEYLEEMNLTYANKVRLACAMGFDPAFKPMLLSLGRIRNSFSHNLHKKIDEAMVKDLQSAMHEKTRVGFPALLNSLKPVGMRFASFSEVHPRDQFTALVCTLWVVLNGAVDQAREQYIFERSP